MPIILGRISLAMSVLAAQPLLALAADLPNENLTARFAKLACAIVRLEGPHDSGTGFFVNSSGLLVTAAHVLFDRSFTKQNNDYPLTISIHWPLNIVRHNGGREQITQPILTQRDIDNAAFDVAAIETGLHSDCFIPLGKPESVNVGDQLISIGFPASSTSGILYAGFLSARHNQVPTMVGPILGTTDFRTITRDIFRVQMPITAGASGSPLITNDDTAVAVISEIPVIWTTELSRLIQTMQNSPGGSGVSLSGFDTTALLAQLALIVKEYESPGAGLAVPISYLKLPLPNTPQKP
jgi:hypothetical protein